MYILLCNSSCDDDLHAAAQAQHKVQRVLLLRCCAVCRKRAVAVKLLAADM
jgi:hypothetical protein